MYSIRSVIAVDVGERCWYSQFQADGGADGGHGFSFNSAESQEAKSTNDESQRRRIC